MYGVVFPLPDPEAPPSKALSQGDVTSASNLYKDDSVEPLENINVTRILAGQICGRPDDTAFNSRVIELTRRAEPFMNVVGVMFVASSVSLFFVADIPTRTAMSYLTAVTGTLIFTYVAATLSWDMLLLLLRTFEFWFLLFINAANDTLWNLMYHDARVVGFLTTGCNFAISLTFDANIYTRRFVTRVLVLGSPGLLLGVALTALRFVPDLHYPTFKLFSVAVDSVDLLVSGNLVITYFTALRVFRSQHLVFSKVPICSITCDMYHPVCQLVPHSQPLVAEEAPAVRDASRCVSVVGPSPALQQLKLLESSAAHDIDLTAVMLPQTARLAQRIPTFVLNGLGLLSHGAGTLGSGQIMVNLSHPDAVLSSPSSALLICASVSAGIFAFVYAANCQRQLVKRICLELDTWFVSVQITIVTVGILFFSLEVYDQRENANADSCEGNCTQTERDYNKGLQVAGDWTVVVFYIPGNVFSWTLPFLVKRFGGKWALTIALIPRALLLIMSQ